MPVLILGYGSPIRGDDAFGPLLAEQLGAETSDPRLRIHARHILTADLIPELLDCDRVIFLDAALDTAPGEIRCQRLDPSRTGGSSMAHFLDPRELLAWCEALYDHRPRAWLLSVGAASLDYASYRLSPEVARVIPAVRVHIERLLEQTPTETGNEA